MRIWYICALYPDVVCHVLRSKFTKPYKMKALKNTINFLLLTSVLTSCMSTYFYQVYEVKPDENIQQETNSLIYEDDNCKILYDLWEQNGNIGFRIYNKTDGLIQLNLEKSFFVLNGTAYQYYQNRTFTSTSSLNSNTSNSLSGSKQATGLNYLGLIQTNKVSAANTVSSGISSGYSVTYEEQKLINIPSRTSKMISEFSINDQLYRNCDLFKYPNKNQINTVSFNESTSPIYFSNRITYSLEESASELREFENSFYISEVTNFPESEIFENRYDEFCEQKSTTQTRYFRESSPNKFYIKYKRGTEVSKH